MDGEIHMLSQTGPFSIPLKCLTKKCLVTLDKTHLEFGEVYIGETVRGRVTLSNAGALGTQYAITSVHTPHQQERPHSSEGVASSGETPAPSQLTEDSKYSIMSDVLDISSRAREKVEGMGVIHAGGVADPLKCRSEGLLNINNRHLAEEGCVALARGEGLQPRSDEVTEQGTEKEGGDQSTMEGGDQGEHAGDQGRAGVYVCVYVCVYNLHFDICSFGLHSWQ